MSWLACTGKCACTGMMGKVCMAFICTQAWHGACLLACLQFLLCMWKIKWQLILQLGNENPISYCITAVHIHKKSTVKKLYYNNADLSTGFAWPDLAILFLNA